MVVINLRCKKITSSYVDKIISVFALSTIPSSIIILPIESAWIFPPSGFFYAVYAAGDFCPYGAFFKGKVAAFHGAVFKNKIFAVAEGLGS